MPKSIVDRETWLRARKELLEREKAFTHEREALNRARRQLPRILVEKDYVFAGDNGEISLAGMFDGKSQLGPNMK